jgi:hypothetical protein
MTIRTGNLITIGKSLWIVTDITRDKLKLVDACHSNCSGILSWKMIGDIMVATTYIEEKEDEDLLEKSRVTFIASSVKSYIEKRAMQIFSEFS